MFFYPKLFLSISMTEASAVSLMHILCIFIGIQKQGHMAAGILPASVWPCFSYLFRYIHAFR